MRALFLALILIAGACRTATAVRNAGDNVSAAAQNISGVAQSVKAIATAIERHVIDAPDPPEIDGTTHQQTPLDVILKAAPVITIDLLAAYRVAAAAWKAIKESREQKAEPVP
jgi:hypothetical protein